LAERGYVEDSDSIMECYLEALAIHVDAARDFKQVLQRNGVLTFAEFKAIYRNVERRRGRR
jgi:hypothetical protein